MYCPVKFGVQKKLKNKLGRAGILKTPHGEIETPVFVAVGTKATVKSLTPEQLMELGSKVVLANTYHLYFQPGDEIIKKAGGLHKFMNWNGPIMTDSGGFQVFSLGTAFGKGIGKLLKKEKEIFYLNLRQKDNEQEPKKVTIGPDGVTFKSHLDGSTHYITPEKSIDIQHNLGADIIFAFDECTSPLEPIFYQREALDRTHRWARRSLDYHQSKENSSRQALFGIVQGGRHEELRKKSAKATSRMDFDGFGIGGSFTKEDLTNALNWVNEILPEEKPRHLLGIGEPEDLFIGVENGVDLFDCVAPTRMARHGTLYTRQGKINILNAKYTEDFSKIDDNCECYACNNYTRGYFSHLFRSKEMLAATLASIHNLYFIISLVAKMRQSILDNNFLRFKADFLYLYKA